MLGRENRDARLRRAPGPVRRAAVAALVATLAAVGLGACGGLAANSEPTIPLPRMSDPPHPFDTLSCVPYGRVRFCAGGFAAGRYDRRISSFDGTPLDADVTLPPASFGPGPYPLIVMLHGLGLNKVEFEFAGNGFDNVAFAQRGYAVLTYSARGFGESCGVPASRTAACLRAGWIHLGDQRYEVRDTQYLAGRLVDEGIALPGIAVTGVSYGAAQALELALLDNRLRLPSGQLAPWVSPRLRIPMHVAATFAQWGWDDLVSALYPNGGNVGAPVSAATDAVPFGVEKESWVTTLYHDAQNGWLPAPDADRSSDFSTWLAEIGLGEPYDPASVRAMTNVMQTYKSAIGIPLPKGGPGPVMLENGSTDTLFPVSEALQFEDRLRAAGDHTPLELYIADIGHSSQNKAADALAITFRAGVFLDAVMLHHTAPPTGVVATGVACPVGTPSGPPTLASSYAALSNAVLQGFVPTPQVVLSTGAATDTPVVATNETWMCAEYPTPPALLPGSAAVDLAPPLGEQVTVAGATDIQADLHVVGDFPELVGELWDVSGSTERLVATGVVRPKVNQSVLATPASGGDVAVHLQLMPTFETIPTGDQLRVTLVGADAPFYRRSNGVFSITVTNLQARLPVRTGP